MIKQINPYNFISLEDCCDRGSISFGNDVLTGYIDCTLLTMTKTIIPGGSDNKEHLTYEPFNYGGRSVIPGSEIRGMLRNDYEAFTNSCLSCIGKEEKMISRKMSFKPKDIHQGVLVFENGHWNLYSVEKDHQYKVKLHLVKDYQDIDDIYIKLDAVERSKLLFTKEENEIGYKKGILFKGEKFPSKKNAYIFVKNSLIKTNIDERVKDLDLMLKCYRDPKINKKDIMAVQDFYKGYTLDRKKEWPIYYALDNNDVYLYLAQIGKEVSHKSLRDLIKGYEPCISKDCICDACKIFGFVSNDGQNAIASKIRVTDAYTEESDIYSNKVTLSELANPHIENPSLYGYSGYVNKDFKGQYVIGYDRNIERIRGRKMYWHHRIYDNNVIPSKMNCTVTPIRENIKYNFRIYFDNIEEIDLKKLLAVINLNYENKRLYHKIGKAKPLGYGSIKLNVNNVKIKHIKFINGKFEYKLDDYAADIKLIDVFTGKINKKYFKECLCIYDFDYISHDMVVRFPRINEDDKGFEWYSKNYNFGRYRYILPEILDSDLSMPIIKNDNYNSKKGRYN